MRIEPIDPVVNLNYDKLPDFTQSVEKSQRIGSLSIELEVRIQKFALLFFVQNNISIIQSMLKNNSVASQCTKQMPMQNVKDIKCQNSYISNFQLHT